MKGRGIHPSLSNNSVYTTAYWQSILLFLFAPNICKSLDLEMTKVIDKPQCTQFDCFVLIFSNDWNKWKVANIQ